MYFSLIRDHPNQTHQCPSPLLLIDLQHLPGKKPTGILEVTADRAKADILSSRNTADRLSRPDPTSSISPLPAIGIIL
jgi:hypothetical protein